MHGHHIRTSEALHVVQQLRELAVVHQHRIKLGGENPIISAKEVGSI